jgi:hypothetical protein
MQKVLESGVEAHQRAFLTIIANILGGFFAQWLNENAVDSLKKIVEGRKVLSLKVKQAAVIAED